MKIWIGEDECGTLSTKFTTGVIVEDTRGDMSKIEQGGSKFVYNGKEIFG